MIQCSCFIVMPAMALLAINADVIVKIMLGDQWDAAIPFLQIACFSYALYPFHTINLQAMNALGRSDMYLKLQIIKETLNLTILLLTYKHGVFTMYAAGYLMGPLSIFINSYPNAKLLGYTAIMQIKDILSIFCSCLFISLLMFYLSELIHNMFAKLMLTTILFSIIYLLTMYFSKNQAFNFYFNRYKHILMKLKKQ